MAAWSEERHIEADAPRSSGVDLLWGILSRGVITPDRAKATM
jgi:hypothetical protein